MAAIDIIENMSNKELVDYYKYCMVARFYELKHRGVSYHPNYNYCRVYIGENNIYKLHYANEMSLLNEMWNRMLTSNFSDQCWWKSQKIFQTNISVSFKKEEDVTPLTYNTPIKKNKETIEYNGDVFEFLASGTKRKTYLSPCKKYIIKVPKEPYALGLLENKTEAETYKANPKSIYAECELIENGWLKMEFVEPKYFSKDDDYPEWTLGIAEHQVGYNLDGKLVAYDYGSVI
jgi:hypothetical protein